MIPQFPEFKKVEISDEKEIRNITNQFPVYSDFNFTSMWSWDVQESMVASRLNTNLVIKFTDYLTGIPFYSFLGEHEADNTIESLLNLLNAQGLEKELKMIPEISVKSANKTKYCIEEDCDHFDYILNNEELTELKGRALHNHANFKKRFIEKYNESIQIKLLDITNYEIIENIKNLGGLWTKNKINQEKIIFPGIEERANERFFMLNKDAKNFVSIGIFQNQELIGFTIDEIVMDNFSIRHFMKADITYKGVYSYLVSESARILATKFNIKYTNIEQDLGLPNLRQAKKSFNPSYFLKKFKLRLI